MATLSVGGQLVSTNDTLSNGVQDNITRLGTVASGVIGSGVTGTIGTGVTFPAGHVIKTVYDTYNGDLSDTSQSEAMVRVVNGSSYNWTGQITDVAADSHVFVQMSFGGFSERSGSEVGCGWGIFRGTSTKILEPRQHAIYRYVQGQTQDMGLYFQLSISVMDTAPNTGTNDYFLGVRSYLSSLTRVRSDSGYEPFRCIMQEIQP